MENQNSLIKGKIKRAKFLTQGLVSYQDSDAGIALLKNETINAGLSSFVGCPVIIDHRNITEKNYAKERKGNVVSTTYNAQDGWYYVDFIVDDEDALEKIEQQGYSVSCAYNVLDVAPGGTYQDIPYDGEIIKISFTHLALVTTPRYEESRILDEMPAMLINSKIEARNITKQEGESMFKLFKKQADGKQEEVTPFVLVNGKEVPLKDLVDAYAANSKDEKYMAKDEDMVDVNGNTISIGELKNAYNKLNEKKNNNPDDTAAGEPEDKGGEEKKKDKQEKEVEKDKAKKDKPEGASEEEEKRAKKNSKEEGDRFFAELENASNKITPEDEGVVAQNHGMTRLERANSWRNKTNKK